MCALAVVAEAVPSRTTVRQALFLAAVARAAAMGRSMTFTDIVESVGDRLLGRSIEKSYAVFGEPNKRNPEALGWVYQETDEDDRRRKYLRFTATGYEALAAVIEAMRVR